MVEFCNASKALACASLAAEKIAISSQNQQAQKTEEVPKAGQFLVRIPRNCHTEVDNVKIRDRHNVESQLKPDSDYEKLVEMERLLKAMKELHAKLEKGNKETTWDSISRWFSEFKSKFV
uniref:Uncharacterized protein n=1 Tax=Caenorhabditis japonica TaxID=281687 RepID=A0A8R1E8U6_CAEJA